MHALILAPYAAILAALYLWLSARIPGFRRRHGKALGVTEDDGFLRAVRAHANFAEYAPFGLLLLYLLAGLETPAFVLHLCAALLVGGRALHAYGLIIAEPKIGSYRFRIAGMVCTFGMLGLSALALAVQWFRFHFA